MPQITKPAVNIRQGDRVLYLTSFTAAEFAAPGFFNVEVLDPLTEDGYQRISEKKRYKRVASDLIAMRGDNNAFLPTTAFLATEAAIDYAPETRAISFDTDVTGPLNVVDGQHRIRGLIEAYKEMPSLADFPLATVIAPNMEKRDQKLHFYLVNTTQKPVDQSVRQVIMARLQKERAMGRKIALPSWLAKEADKDSLPVAIDIAKFLNENQDSPWCGRILMANPQKAPGAGKIKQNSFVVSVQKFVLVRGHFLHQSGMREEMRNERLRNYWSAVADIFAGDDADKSVVFGSTGAIFFHSVSMPMFNWLSVSGDYTVPRIKECFRLAFKELADGDDHRLSSVIAWRKGNEASGWNGTEALGKADIMATAIYQASQKEKGGGAL